MVVRFNKNSIGCPVSRLGPEFVCRLFGVAVTLLIVAAMVSGVGCSQAGTSIQGPVVQDWAAKYGAEGHSSHWNYGYDIAVDASGNVHVAGSSSYGDAGNDYLTVKYDSNGREAWSARYDGPSNSVDVANAITVDESGNVYVTGGSTITGQLGQGPYDHDYTTIKYGPDGTQLWLARYNGPGNFYDEANAIALDSSGNVYVTGTSSLTGYGTASSVSEYATVKYDGNGKELWVARYHGPYGGIDCANSIAVDGGGNIFVTGYSGGRDYETSVALGGQHDYDYATVKYDANGHQLWVARYAGPGSAYSAAAALALDGSGNVYVTGRSQGAGSDDDCLTVKYSATGEELWVARCDGPASGQDSARDIGVDAQGNAYVTGYMDFDNGGINDRDYATVKYDANGNELWMRRYGSPPEGDASGGIDEAYAIAVDTAGNACVTGESCRGGKDEHADNDSVTIKYDTNGTQVWVARCYSGGGETAIELDNSGNVYVTGHSNPSGSIDCLTIKYIPK